MCLQNQRCLCLLVFLTKEWRRLNCIQFLKTKEYVVLLKVPEAELGDIAISYKHVQTTGSKFLNHCKELRKLYLHKLSSITESQCGCSSSEFCYLQAGHIVSGDLRLVADSTLRQLFSFGTNYRIPCDLDWEDTRAAAVEAVEESIMKICNKFKIPPHLLQEFEVMCCEIIDKRIAFFRNQTQLKKTMQFQRDDLKQAFRELRLLQDKFIIAPADKASNNYIFVCKKYYFQIMCNEMGLHKLGSSWSAVGEMLLTK